MTPASDELPSRRRPPPPFEAASLRALATVLILAIVIAGLYFASTILVPFALAILLSFLLAPVVRWLRRLHLGRAGAVTLTLVITFVVIVSFGAFIGRQVAVLGEKLPEYRSNIEAKIRTLPNMIGGGTLWARADALLQDLHAELVHAQKRSRSPAQRAAERQSKPLAVVVQANPTPFAILRDVVKPLLEPIETAGLVVVFCFLILLEREDLRDRMLRLAGVRDLQRTTAAMNEAAARIGRWLISKLALNIACAVPIGLGLAVIGIPNAALWGALVLLLRFLPYLGTFVAAAFPVALAIAVDPGWSLLLWTVLLFVTVETIINYVVEPLLYGASTGLSAVAVIGSAVFWAWLWGPVGLLLSTPLTVCLVVLGRHVPQLRFLSVILGNEPGLAPEETFYQRLLARDPEEATEQAEDFAKERSLAAFFDEVIVPALVIAKEDSDRGALSAAQRAIIRDGIREMIEDLAEDIEPENAEARRPRVLCISGRGELDEAAARFVTHLLRRAGYDAADIGGEAIAPDSLERFALDRDAVVCLSLIGTTSLARARYFARRMRRRLPELRLVLGLWGMQRDEIDESPDTIPPEAAEPPMPTTPAAGPELRWRGPGAGFFPGLWGTRRKPTDQPPAPPPVETVVTTFREFIIAIDHEIPDLPRIPSISA